MNNIIIQLINNSFSASWLIIAIIIFRICFSKLSKKTSIFLWLILGIRLIIPFNIESVYSLIPSSTIIQYSNQEKITINSGLNLIDNKINIYLDNTESTIKTLDIFELFKVIYIVVLCILIIYSFINYFKFKNKLNVAIKLENNIYKSDIINTSIVFGLISPKIYLPFGIDQNNQEYILMHENIHLKRKDYLTKFVAYIITLIYWFNPLMWLSYYLLEKDIEMLCDEEVIKKLNSKKKAEYSKALFDLSANNKHNVYILSFNEIAVKERIKAILNYSKPKFYISLISIVLILLIGICFLTSPKKEYTLKAIIPPLSKGDTIYTDSFIIPYKNQISINAPDNVDEGEIILKSKEETLHLYFSKGLSQRVKVQKDVAYDVLIRTYNSSNKELEVYIKIKNTDVAIEDRNQFVDNYDLIDVFSKYKNNKINDYVYTNDNAYGLNGVVEYIEDDISYLSFFYDKDKFQTISIDTDKRYSSFSNLTYLNKGKISITSYDEEKSQYFEHIISFSKDENNSVIFKNETKQINKN